MKNELQHLQYQYFSCQSGLGDTGFHAISRNDFISALHELQPYDRPDMYAELDDTILFLEHFEFDASSRTRKGMAGVREEKSLDARASRPVANDEWYLDTANYKISFDDWVSNFEHVFSDHYEKIDAYCARIQNEVGHCNKRILAGFWAEQLYSPIIEDRRSGQLDIYELPYIFTTQFLDFFQPRTRLDFVLFSGYYGRRPTLFYTDHQQDAPDSDYIDLQCPQIVLSRLNQSEVTAFGSFDLSNDN